MGVPVFWAQEPASQILRAPPISGFSGISGIRVISKFRQIPRISATPGLNPRNGLLARGFRTPGSREKQLARPNFGGSQLGYPGFLRPGAGPPGPSEPPPSDDFSGISGIPVISQSRKIPRIFTASGVALRNGLLVLVFRTPAGSDSGGRQKQLTGPNFGGSQPGYPGFLGSGAGHLGSPRQKVDPLRKRKTPGGPKANSKNIRNTKTGVTQTREEDLFTNLKKP